MDEKDKLPPSQEGELRAENEEVEENTVAHTEALPRKEKKEESGMSALSSALTAFLLSVQAASAANDEQCQTTLQAGMTYMRSSAGNGNSHRNL